jgi:hypothetical protein
VPIFFLNITFYSYVPATWHKVDYIIYYILSSTANSDLLMLSTTLAPMLGGLVRGIHGGMQGGELARQDKRTAFHNDK